MSDRLVNLLRILEYEDQQTLIEPERVQMHRLRGELIDVIDINLTEFNGQPVTTFNSHTPSIVTLKFEKDLNIKADAMFAP